MPNMRIIGDNAGTLAGSKLSFQYDDASKYLDFNPTGCCSHVGNYVSLFYAAFC